MNEVEGDPRPSNSETLVSLVILQNVHLSLNRPYFEGRSSKKKTESDWIL